MEQIIILSERHRSQQLLIYPGNNHDQKRRGGNKRNGIYGMMAYNGMIHKKQAGAMCVDCGHDPMCGERANASKR